MDACISMSFLAVPAEGPSQIHEEKSRQSNSPFGTIRRSGNRGSRIRR
jgi:hypothetical protein